MWELENESNKIGDLVKGFSVRVLKVLFDFFVLFMVKGERGKIS